MEAAVFEQVAVGSTMIAWISVFLLPMAVWDSQTGRYYGYFNWKAAAVLLFTAVFFGFLGYRAGHDAWQIFGDICFNLHLAVIGSRIFVELSNHHMHKVWLHRQYHKLTGHQDTRMQVASDALDNVKWVSSGASGGWGARADGCIVYICFHCRISIFLPCQGACICGEDALSWTSERVQSVTICFRIFWARPAQEGRRSVTR